MVIVKIAEHEYNLPESWDEVSLEKFRKIVEKNQLISEYKSQILFGLEILSILIDCSVEDLKNISKASFETLVEEIKWIHTAPVAKEKEEFTILGERWKPIKDLNKLTMGDNISLELMINNSTEATLLINILPILLRKAKVVKLESGELKEELMPFDDKNYEELKDAIQKNIFITEVMSFKDFI